MISSSCIRPLAQASSWFPHAKISFCSRHSINWLGLKLQAPGISILAEVLNQASLSGLGTNVNLTRASSKLTSGALGISARSLLDLGQHPIQSDSSLEHPPISDFPFQQDQTTWTILTAHERFGLLSHSSSASTMWYRSGFLDRSISPFPA